MRALRNPLDTLGVASETSPRVIPSLHLNSFCVRDPLQPTKPNTDYRTCTCCLVWRPSRMINGRSICYHCCHELLTDFLRRTEQVREEGGDVQKQSRSKETAATRSMICCHLWHMSRYDGGFASRDIEIDGIGSPTNKRVRTRGWMANDTTSRLGSPRLMAAIKWKKQPPS